MEGYESCPAKFVWEGDDTVWVMGALGDSLLRKLHSLRLPDKVEERPQTTTSEVVTLERRQRCQARLQIVHGTGCPDDCGCPRYSPVVFLPHSLVNKLELSLDIATAARQMLTSATYPSGTCANDFQLDIQDTANLPLWRCDLKGHAMWYRVRPDRKAAATAAGRGSTQLDTAEFEVNCALLEQLLQFCEQYCSIKIAQKVEAAKTEADEAATKANVKANLGRLGRVHSPKAPVRSAKVGQPPTAPTSPPLSPMGAPSPSGDKGSPTKAETSNGAEITKPEKPAKPKVEPPKMLCRCGHAEVWHTRDQGLAICEPCLPDRPQSRPSDEASPPQAGMMSTTTTLRPRSTELGTSSFVGLGRSMLDSKRPPVMTESLDRPLASSAALSGTVGKAASIQLVGGKLRRASQ
eukprot:gnl/TRDRNA2_/TRDRNA2_156234_c1_seq1.p1 gnl/TRDRNA2_/TRDRNA2_156234_c1~~gnl/TRDRNA2_/TRDRNA2_156234_c1_seq1.p1  ORF type:complete len:425 (+),score=69.26 gnl/TRDRNA2_/TRDRNA2_156234_c1_seq1:56-1276(+)